MLGSINGQPGLLFGPTDTLANVGPFNFDMHPHSFFLVLTSTNGGGNDFAFSILTPPDSIGSYIRVQPAVYNAVAPVLFGSSSDVDVNTGFVANDTNAVIVRHENQAPGDILDNLGNTGDDIDVGELRTPGTEIRVSGFGTGGSAPMQGYIQAVGFYTTRLTDEERTQLMNYNIARWGL